MSSICTADNGIQIDEDNVTIQFPRDGGGKVVAMTTTYAGNAYKRTISRDGSGNVIEITKWELQ